MIAVFNRVGVAGLFSRSDQASTRICSQKRRGFPATRKVGYNLPALCELRCHPIFHCGSGNAADACKLTPGQQSGCVRSSSLNWLVAEVPALPTIDDGIANQNYLNANAVRLLCNSEVSLRETRSER